MRQIFSATFAMLVFLVFWEVLVWVNDWPNYKMASPSDLWPAFWRFKGLFLVYGWETLWRTVVGLLLAILVGSAIGMLMGLSRFAREGLYPLLVGFNAIPKATVVPIVALIFVGQHDLNTVLIAFMISFFQLPFQSQLASRLWSLNTGIFSGHSALPISQSLEDSVAENNA